MVLDQCSLKLVAYYSQNKTTMNSVVANYSIPGTVYSIVPLSLVVPVMFMFRQYFRSLDFVQMSYLFGLVMYSTSFSTNLTISFAGFNYNFLTFCQTGDLVCTLGFQLSLGCVLVGLLLLFAIFIGLQRCGGNTKVEFEPVYLAFKGFFKWIYLPYAYYSSYYLVTAADQALNQSKIDTTKLIQAAAIAGFCFLFPFIQLIGYKCIQTEETPIWRKWIEFFDYLRLMATGALLGLYNYYHQVIYLHCIMVMLIIYPLITIWKGEYKYPVLERVIFGLGEAAFLANFFIFKYRPEYIKDYDLDFFFLGFVLLIDILLYLVRGCRVGCYGVNENNEVNPETAIPEIKKKEKPNKYEHDSGSDLQNSREGLIVNVKIPQPLPSKKSKK